MYFTEWGNCIQLPVKRNNYESQKIEQYPDDYPWPSCLVLGYSGKRPLHICMGSNGDAAKLITAYWPDPEKWSIDFKQRKENES